MTTRGPILYVPLQPVPQHPLHGRHGGAAAQVPAPLHGTLGRQDPRGHRRIRRQVRTDGRTDGRTDAALPSLAFLWNFVLFLSSAEPPLSPFRPPQLSLPVGNRMEGKRVTIINRSEIVGRPLGALLANDGRWLMIIIIIIIIINRWDRQKKSRRDEAQQTD